MIADSGNADITDRCLEFDERVSSVVCVAGTGFAAGTEVGVMADGALVTVSLNVRLNTIAGVAKWSIAVDAVVASLAAV
jgi:hypothetical protein